MRLTKKMNQRQVKIHMKRKLIGIGFIVISGFLLVSIILTQRGIGNPEQIGLAGGFFSRTLMGILGRAGFVLPSVGLLLGFLFLVGVHEDDIKTNVIGFFFILLSILGIFSIEDVLGMTFLTAVQNGMQGYGGGIIGMSFGWALSRVIGRWGAYIVLGGILLAGILMLFEGYKWNFLSKIKQAWETKKAKKLALKKKQEKDASLREKGKTVFIPNPTGPVISHSGHHDESNYESIKDILMDEDIGKKHSRKPANSSLPVQNTMDREGQEVPLEEQMEISLKSDRVDFGAIRDWKYPPLSLLRHERPIDKALSDKEIQETAMLLEQTLESFGVQLKIDQVSIGPSITRYEAKLAPGIKVSKILRLSDDIALSLAASNIRIEAPIPGKEPA